MKKHLHGHLMIAAIIHGFQDQRASVKYGAIVSELKGKLGGQVFKGGASGGVMMTKNQLTGAVANGSKLTKADAGRTVNPQQNIGNNASTWKALTGAQRATWIAAAPNFPFKNKFGETYTPSGYQLYMSINTNLLLVNEPVLTDAPEVPTLESCPAFTVAPSTSPTATFYMTGTIPTGYKMTVYGTAPMSAGRAVTKGNKKAIIIFDDTQTFPVSLDTAYSKIFGTLPSAGTVWFEGKLTKADAGRTSQAYQIQVTI